MLVAILELPITRLGQWKVNSEEGQSKCSILRNKLNSIGGIFVDDVSCDNTIEPHGLPAGTICTQLNGKLTKSHILWRLHCPILINFWYYERGTSENFSSFYFHNSRIYVEIMKQNVLFTIGPVPYLSCHKIQRMHKVTLIVDKGLY